MKLAPDIDLPSAPASDGGATPPSHERPARNSAPTPIPDSPGNESASDQSSFLIHNPTFPPDLVPRLRLLHIVLAAALLVLLAALAYHQLVRSADYTALGERQSQRRLLSPAPRGAIFDREHRLLAGTERRTSLALDLGRLRREFAAEERPLLVGPTRGTTSVSPKTDALPSSTNRPHPSSARHNASPPRKPPNLSASARARQAVVQRHLDRASTLLGRTVTAIDAAQLERHFARNRLAPFVLIPDLTDADLARLQPILTPAAPLLRLHTPTRAYPHAHVAAHLLGRVRSERIPVPVSPDAAFATLDYTDLTGDFGLEKQYDTLLRGTPSSQVLRLDASGFPISASAESAATPGRDLTLSLDLDLQRAAETALDDTTGSIRGSAVAIDIRTGEILALVSRPGFDLNAVSPSISAATKQQLDTSGAWLNRATQALYPPGSTFKIFTVLAGLRSGALNPDTVHRCDGFLQIGNRRFPCHHAAGHGELTLATALAHSCNIFAARTGLAAGPDAIAAEARRFHFAESTGIDLPSETTRSLIPDPSWKTGDNRGPWTDGDTVNLAIGQGFLRISPLQAACAMASLARRETLTIPTLLRQPGRRPSGERAPEPLDISDTDYAALVTSLRAVVETGIGREAQVPGIQIAGKTGTAQIATPDGTKNIAWFLAFAPADRPEIAVAIALESDTPGVEYAGAQHAAPIARELLGTYFDKQVK